MDALAAYESAKMQIEKRLPTAVVSWRAELDSDSGIMLLQLDVKIDEFDKEVSDFLDSVDAQFHSFFTIVESFRLMQEGDKDGQIHS